MAAESRPEVRLLWPSGKSLAISESPLRLRLAVRTYAGAGPVRVMALADGREIPVRNAETPSADDPRPSMPPVPPLTSSEQPLNVFVSVPPADCFLSIQVEQNGATSLPAQIHLFWKGAVGGTPRTPKLYILSIGISAYRDERMALVFPRKDASDLVSILAPQEPRFYRQIEARSLLDGQATRTAVLEGLQWISDQTTERDVAIVFLAGHGVVQAARGEFFFVPYDGDLTRPYDETLVSGTQVRRALEAVAGKAILFLDSCHGGAVLPDRRSRSPDDVGPFLRELQSTAPGLAVFSATRARDVAQEWSEWGNGAFTKALIEGLSGQADRDQTGRVTVNMLAVYISERVKALTGGRQKTISQVSNGEDFPLALSQTGLRLASSVQPSAPPSPRSIAKRPRWRLMLGGAAIGASLLVSGFAVSALSVDNQIINPSSTTPMRRYDTSAIGGGLLGAGALGLAAGILTVAMPPRRE